MNKWFYLFLVLAIVWNLQACGGDDMRIEDANGIYYWRTTLHLNDREREFVRKHKVAKMYVRFFDVERDWDAENSKEIVPSATILFQDSLPENIEVIPAIYITPSAIEKMQFNEGEFAAKILKRINAMCRRNKINFKEIQLDCDWTQSTRDPFFRLCEEVKARLDSTQSLSSTIRLHQLSQTPPPVDKGVLMVYNTGNLMEMTTDNSIFSAKDIEPYLRDNRLAGYTLPLDVAYPAYGWSVVYYRAGDVYRFNRLLQRTDFSAYPEIKKIGDNLFEATKSVNFDPEKNDWFDVSAGDRIRVERPDAKEILQVKNMIETQLKGKPHSTILYHLDESQLSHYSDNEIDKIYHGN